jgi:RNA polymerase sigma-70 factor (ECF subfamily)
MAHAGAPRSDRVASLFEAHHRRVLAYALRRSPTVADAEDVVAETFAIAWRRIGDLPPGVEGLPWLLAIARRVAANQGRGRRRWLGLIDRLRSRAQEPASFAPESPATDALARLPTGDQELLRLLAWDGLSQAEAGTVLGISANAVAIRLHRARRRFARELDAVTKGIDPDRTSPRVKGTVPGRSARDRSS